VEDIFVDHGSAVIHLDIDEIGIDAVYSGTQGFKEHGGKSE